jgi:hypothetical protein
MLAQFEQESDERMNRRNFLKKNLLGTAGLGAAFGLEEKALLAALQDGGTSAAKPGPDAASRMPCGKIGDVSVSRLFLGGNLIGGWAHSRDLLYVSKLFKAYNTEAKIFETLELAEQAGINSILMDPRDWAPVRKYNRERKRNFQSVMVTLPSTPEAAMGDHVKELVDNGASMVYLHGCVADPLVMNGRVDVIGRTVELIKLAGVPAGVGGHSLETVMACEKNRIAPDFYVKTFHSDRYWSATPREKREEWCWYKGFKTERRYHDNMFCLDAGKTAAFMETVKRPWIAFKTMAAGAIHPRAAFPDAFKNGADFIVAGMFDFQIAEDAALAVEAIHASQRRKRPWHG